MKDCTLYQDLTSFQGLWYSMFGWMPRNTLKVWGNTSDAHSLKIQQSLRGVQRLLTWATAWRRHAAIQTYFPLPERLDLDQVRDIKNKSCCEKKATDSKYTLQTFKYCAVSSSTAFHPKMSSKVKKKKKVASSFFFFFPIGIKINCDHSGKEICYWKRKDTWMYLKSRLHCNDSDSRLKINPCFCSGIPAGESRTVFLEDKIRAST